MTLNRRHAAIGALVVGMTLAVAGLALTVSAWNAIQFVRSNLSHDVYFVMPDAWILLVFGIGVVGDVLFGRRAAQFGRRAVFIWRSHLVFTSVVLVAGLVVAKQTEMTWSTIIVLFAITPLMLLAHGVALTAGGLQVLRTTGVRRP